MKKFIYPIFLLITISCSSPEKVEEEPDTSKIGGQLYLNTNDFDNQRGRYFQIMGNINPEPGVWGNIEAGIMTISNVDLTFVPAHDGYDAGDLYDFESLNGQVPLFGGVGRWGITGDKNKGIKGFSTTMYTPRIIEILAPPKDIKVSKKDTLKIEWEPDPDYEGLVHIWVHCLLGCPGLFLDTPDSGVYYLTMDSIDVRCFTIELTRSNMKWVKVGDRWYQLIAMTGDERTFEN